MPTRGPLARVLLGAGVLCVAPLALVGGVALRGSGVIAILLAGAVGACLAAGVVRETPGPRRRGVLEAACLTGAVTVAALLAVAGVAVLAGGVVAATVTGAGGLLALSAWLLRSSRDVGPAGKRAAPRTAPGTHATAPPRPLSAMPWHVASATTPNRADAGAARVLPPVAELPTDALGREWVRTSASLAGRLEPAVRESIVRRRQDALDELERRDPDGFARWLAGGAQPGSDPAEYVRDAPAAGSDAA